MKKIVSYLTIISLLLITFSCGGSGSAKGVSPVTVLASFEGFKSKSTSQRTASSPLTNIRYTVTGSGMDTMTDTVSVTGNLVEFTLNVPNGLQRHFLIEALDINNQVKYSGEANRDLDGTPVTIEISLVPTTPLSNMRDYFPLGQGDTWMYDDYDIETISGTESIDGANAVKMTQEDGDYQLFTNSNGITYYKKYDANDLEGCGWSQSVFIPSITLLPAEVSIGVKYTSNFTTNYTNCRGESKTTTSSAEFTVEGIEDVTVPAGTFKDCLKIKIKFNNMFSDQGQIESSESTVWLAKGVGEVKTTDEDTGEDTRKLISATVGGVSYPSNDTTPPSVPTNLTAAPFSATEIDLSWSPSTDNVAMAGFKVYDSNGTFLKTVTANAASITGLSPDTQYCFTVSAYDTSGNESGKSSQACAKTLISGGSDTTPPSIPTNFTATTVSATQIDMSWNPSTDNIAMAGYKVYDYFGGAYLKSVTMTFTSFTGLSPDTQYCFTVSAYDTSGNESGKSSQACATTPACLTGTWTSTDLPYISMTLNQVGSSVTSNWVNSNTGCAYTGSGFYNSSTTFLTITFTTGMNPVQCCQSFTYNGTVSNCNSMSLGWTNNCSFSGGRQY